MSSHDATVKRNLTPPGVGFSVCGKGSIIVHDSEGAGEFVRKGHGARGLFVDIEAALFYRNRQPPRRSFLTLARLGDKKDG